MKTLTYLSISLLFLSCGGEIKNEQADLTIEDGTDYSENDGQLSVGEKKSNHRKIKNSKGHVHETFLGYWVGDFEPDMEDDEISEKSMYLDEGYIWNRTNKINISIDEITDDVVKGHSVVAGNDRPFEGKIESYSDSSFTFKVKEPGDDKYDGAFKFTISDGKLIGTWQANKKIEISKRKFELTRKVFAYDPKIKLEKSRRYANWRKAKHTKSYEEDAGEMYEWIESSFASSSEKIYEMNASTTLLQKKDVENLKKGDLEIIRNTIYARHGYSYKNRVFRLFFDAQSWYIPVHTDIKKELTEIEKKNIQLLLRYEKNAKEYYDYFGRG